MCIMPEVALLWQFQTLNAAHSEMGLRKGKTRIRAGRRNTHTHIHTTN